MSKKNYDEASVIRILERKNSINIYRNQRQIEVLKDHTDVGNGSWGKIDYLRNVHGYVVIRVKQLGKSKNTISGPRDSKFSTKEKTNIRKPKLNMAGMTKTAMKKVATK